MFESDDWPGSQSHHLLKKDFNEYFEKGHIARLTPNGSGWSVTMPHISLMKHKPAIISSISHGIATQWVTCGSWRNARRWRVYVVLENSSRELKSPHPPDVVVHSATVQAGVSQL